MDLLAWQWIDSTLELLDLVVCRIDLQIINYKLEICGCGVDKQLLDFMAWIMIIILIDTTIVKMFDYVSLMDDFACKNTKKTIFQH